jgi:hypothetical protein
MNPESSTPRIWPMPVAAVSSIAVFAATFFAYAERHRMQKQGSYLPAIFGIVVFVAVMSVLTVAMIPKGKNRLGLVLGIVIAEAATFAYALMFLLLNIYGS